MARILRILLSMVLVLSCCAQAQLDQLWKKASNTAASANTKSRGLSNDKIAAGLKEALNVSTRNAVASTGRTDGFLKNAAIKILIPEKLRAVDRGMRLIGRGAQMDELEIGMNRAAEQAVPEAKQIFLDAVMQMSFGDARRILSGGDTAATEYFKQQTSEQLSAAFQPIVHEKMESLGVLRQYNQMLQNRTVGPLLRSRGVDLEAYVLGKSLDGLFYVLGQEEKKIRRNPAAQTTALLRDVFGKRF